MGQGKLTIKSIGYRNDHTALHRLTMVGARVTMQGVVRHGGNTVLSVLLGAHAACTRLVTTKCIVVLVAIL